MTRVLAFTVLALAHAGMALATELSTGIGRIKSVDGTAEVIRDGARIPARPGMNLARADTLATGPDGALGVTFADNSRFALGPDTEVRLDRFEFDTTTHEGRFVSRVGKGRLSVISGRLAKSSPDAMQVHTPSQILGVRGTAFLVRVDP
jgi:hypothetical protein